MNKVSDNQLREIKSQINAINSAISKSGSNFRLIYAAQNFWPFFLVTGVLSIFLPLILHVLIISFGTYQQIPDSVKIIFYTAVVLGWITLIVIQTVISIRAAKKLDLKPGLFAIVKEMLISKIWVAVIPLIVCALVIPVKFPVLHLPAQYIAYSGIVVGLVLNIIGVMSNENEYSFSGFLMTITGLAILLFFAIPGHIAFCITYAPACFIFVIIARVLSKNKRNRNETN
jgi:hypothetical protein